jgi:hypothetical protein
MSEPTTPFSSGPEDLIRHRDPTPWISPLQPTLSTARNRISGIAHLTGATTIEVVRGTLDRKHAEDLLSFWWGRRALSGQEAQRRLPEVVCLLRRDGAVIGASSVYESDVALVGGRRFWIYRSLLDEAAADQGPKMTRATFTALQDQFEGSPEAPIGLCLLLSPEELRLWSAEAVWPDPRMIYAGYLGDGRQVRLAYFENALIATPSPGVVVRRRSGYSSALDSGYSIEPFAEQELVSGEDMAAFWTQEGALALPEAQRRVAEILLVASDRAGRPVGVCTTVPRRIDQLRAELWYTRVFVGAAHRQSHLAVGLALGARDRLAGRFASGEDRRAIGIVFEVESEILKHFLPQAIWPRTDFAFIGETSAGSHVRVFYFPGAPAPEPG